MNGFEMPMRDQYMGLPFLPPDQDGYFFLPFDQITRGSRCERHHFEFEAYLPSDLTRPVAWGEKERCFYPADRRQIVDIWNGTFR
jgi:hypothetical protein